jgi:drug/metabolite transporter (DMT)-like permease
MIPARWQSALLLFCLGTSWATRLLAVKATSVGTNASPLEIAFISTAGIVALVTAANAIRRKAAPVNCRYLRFYLGAGTFGFGAPLTLELGVSRHIPALLFVVIVTSTPIWTMIIAVLTQFESISWRKACGAVSGFGATVLVILGTMPQPSGWQWTEDFRWLAPAFLIPITYGGYLLYVANRWPVGLDNLQAAQGQSTIALIILLPVVISSGQIENISKLEINAWAITIVCAAEIAGLMSLFQLARMKGGSYASQANYIAVIVGSILGVVFFGQRVSSEAFIGIAALLFALYFIELRPAQREYDS